MDVARYFDDAVHRDWQAATEGTVRFAMVGLGWWTQDHAIPAVEKAERCETTVLVSGSPEKARDLASAHETVESCLSYEEFERGEAVEEYDAVYICTPNALHLDQVRAAAGHGKDVLCEKPMEATVERAQEMVDTARSNDVELMIAYRMQTEPAVRRARELVRDGFVGDPLHVHGHMSQVLLEMIPDPGQWRLNPDLAGAGTSVTDIGIYPINTTRFVIDDDPVSASATMVSESEGFEAVPDERAGFVLSFSNGCLATMSASQNAYRTSHLKIIGSEGELTLEPGYIESPDMTLTLSRGDADVEVALETVDQMEEEFEYFADRLLTGRPVHPDGEHGFVDMRTIAAIYESAETGARTPI
jgi:xylose dehydrogenase (NAD/NADP)